jgi:glycosyltransferase involved in cell wall biosynthesis
VVGARAGGVPDVIDDGEDGLLVPFGDAEATAAAIGRLLRDRDLAHRLGAAGQAKLLRQFTWDRIYAQVRAVYSELVPLEL